MIPAVGGRSDECSLTVGNVRLVVDPDAGGRVTSFSFDGTNILAGPEVDRVNYGSTLWTSPQTDWGWPPPAEFDSRRFDITREGGEIKLVGPASETLGVRLVKRFSIDEPTGAIVLDYELKNVGGVPRTYSAWEVSRVQPGGLTFFPHGSWHGGALPVIRLEGSTWYRHDPSQLDDVGKKHVADGALGVIGHAAHGLLFVKSFDDRPHEEQAPGEGEIEVYGNCRYVEVEAQGPYVTIPPGDSTRWQVRWALIQIPPSVRLDVGNPGLLDLAVDLAANGRR